MFLACMEWVISAAVAAFFILETIIPLWRGTKLFPFLRGERCLLSQLREARQKTVERKIAKEIKKERGL